MAVVVTSRTAVAVRARPQVGDGVRLHQDRPVQLLARLFALVASVLSGIRWFNPDAVCGPLW